MARAVMLAGGFIVGAAYIILYFANCRKYEDMVNGVDPNVFFMPDIFVVGIAVVDMLKLNTSKKNPKTKAKLAELFGKQYVEFYSMIMTASTISYVMLFLALALLFGAMTGEPVIMVLLFMVSLMLPLYISMNIDTKIKQMHEEILLDYPNILSKMALLINAGMMLREAWQTVGSSGSRKLYREMQNVTKLIENGTAEIDAYGQLAETCKVNEIKKFASIVCQNIEKGSSELVHVMKELSVDAWTVKKNVAKMKGDSASAKLIIPIGLTFVAILGMIMIPIMANMNLGM